MLTLSLSVTEETMYVGIGRDGLRELVLLDTVVPDPGTTSEVVHL